MKRLEMKQRAISALFVVLASSLRLLKHAAVGSFQFVNFPAVFTIIGGLMLGYEAGAFIGVTSFVVSDVLIGYAGWWTIATSISMGFVGILSPLIHRMDADSSRLGLGVCSYLLVLTYDVLSSVASWLPFVPLELALAWSIIGLFFPSPPAFYPVGLVTEIVTTALIVLIYSRVKIAWKEVKP